MSRAIRSFALAVLASAALAGTMAPDADAQWRRGRGGAVAAGVAAGVIGGVALGALAARQGPYAYGGPVYAEPGYGGPAYAYAPGYEEEAVVVERPAYPYGSGYGYGSPQSRRVVTRPEGRNTMYDTIDRTW